MFHHNQRLMGLFEDVADSVVHFLDTVRVKVGGRLVKQQQARDAWPARPPRPGADAARRKVLVWSGRAPCSRARRCRVMTRTLLQIFIFRQVQVLAAESGVVSRTFQNRLRSPGSCKHQPCNVRALVWRRRSVDEQLAFLLAFVISTEHAGQDRTSGSICLRRKRPSNSTRSPGLYGRSRRVVARNPYVRRVSIPNHVRSRRPL